jgi:hypothetical protein
VWCSVRWEYWRGTVNGRLGLWKEGYDEEQDTSLK